MATAEVGFAAVSRAVVAAAADLVAEVERRVVGHENVRTARGNAWAAICADRARAQARADMDALVAALAAENRRKQAGGNQSGRHRSGGDRNGGNQSGAGRDARQRAVGSSPRSSASQAALVSTR